MLVNGEEHGMNFLNRTIFEYARSRVKEKRRDETIDTYRLFNNMLSSQPMCFNLFVPLRAAARRQFLSRIFQRSLPHLNIERVIKVRVEYVPVPIEEYINDKSAFDAFVEFRANDGNNGCIAIETKYVDKLGKNSSSDMSTKVCVAKEIGCFTDSGLKRTESECPQIARNFLLVEKYGLNNGLTYSHSVVLALRDDAVAVQEVAEFRDLLLPHFKSKIEKVNLEDFVEAVTACVPESEKRWIGDFHRRYLDFEAAERALEALFGAGSKR